MAELEACREGVALALEWSSLPFITGTDCMEATGMINKETINRTRDACLIQEIKTLLRSEREVVVKAIRCTVYEELC